MIESRILSIPYSSISLIKAISDFLRLKVSFLLGAFISEIFTGKSNFNFFTAGASLILLLMFKFGFWFYFYIT